MNGKKSILIVLMAALILAVTGCSGNKTGGAVVKVNGEAISMNEVMYYIYGAEIEGNASEEMYQVLLGKSYWDEIAYDGKTYRELVKEDILENAVRYEIFYLKAKEAGYTLDEDEKSEIRNDAVSFLDSLTEKQKTAMNITLEELITVFEKISLAYYYYNDFIETLDVDEAMAASMITEEDYRQYDVEYIYLPTVNYDEDYQPVPFSQEEKKEAYEKMEGLLQKALDGKELSDLIPEEDEVLELSEIGFLEGDELFGAAFEKEALKLKNGQVADKIIEEEDGYYIIKMIDDFSLESYEQKVEDAIYEAQAEAFQAAYEKLKEEFKIVINEKVWGPVVIGTLTYDENAEIPEEDFEWEDGDYELKEEE